MNELFENKVVNDGSPIHHNENIFDFINRSSDERIIEVKLLMNIWFSNYPEIEKKELRKRFRDEFEPAFYELFLHELFKRQGFEIEIHPKMPHTNKRPDFLLKKQNIELYLEATVSTDKSAEDKAWHNRVNNLYDMLNKTTSPDFYLRIVELNFKTDKQPRSNIIISLIEKELKKLNPDDWETFLTETGFEQLPQITHEDDDILIKISFVPKSLKARGRPGARAIGMYPFSINFGGAEDSIKNSLIKKCRRYGRMDKPYILCVNSLSEKRVHEFDVMNALFGSLQFVTYTNRNNPNDFYHAQERAPNGFFYDATNAKNTRVTGVLITNVHISNIFSASHWFVKHPFAEKSVNFSEFELSYYEVISNQIEKIIKKEIKNVIVKNSLNYDIT